LKLSSYIDLEKNALDSEGSILRHSQQQTSSEKIVKTKAFYPQKINETK